MTHPAIARATLTAEGKLRRARAELALNRQSVFYAALAYRLDFVEVDPATSGIDTAATDGAHIFWARAFIDSLTTAQTTGLLLHEVLHVVLAHHLRRGSRDPKRWNIAGDYVINLLALEAGFQLPANGLVNRSYANWTTDAVYDSLPTPQQQPQPGGGQGDPSGGQQPGQPQPGGGQSDPNSGQQPGQPQPGQGDPNGGQQPGQGNQPGGQSGQPQPGQPGSTGQQPGRIAPAGYSDPGGTGGVIDARNADGTPLDATGRAVAEANLKAAISHAARLTHEAGVGNLPGMIAEIIRDLHRPVIHWADELRMLLADCFTRLDYSYNRLDRRFHGSNIIMPGTTPDAVDNVVFGVDTSGSMSTAELAACFSEVAGMSEQNGGRMHVLGCDTQVHTARTFESGEPVDAAAIADMPARRGGTRLRAIFEHVAEHIPDCAILIIATDGQLGPNDWPEYAPNHPVVWVTTEGGATARKDLPFGPVLTLPKSRPKTA